MNEQAPVRKNTFLDKLLFRLSIVASLCLLLSHLASYVSPRTIWWLAMFGLGFGSFAVINLSFLLYWILRRSRRLLLPLLTLLLTGNKLLGIYEIRMSGSALPPHALQVMTFNVRLFDLYNWYHNDETRKQIFAMLKKESPDIVCFQEYFTSESKDYDYNNKDTLKKILECSYSHLYYSLSLHEGKDHWGLATYSRYPIINKQVVLFDSSRRKAFIYSDVVAGSDTFRIMNVHLESIGFKSQDYRFLEKLGEEDQEEVTGAVNIARRLKRAFVRRSQQAELLHSEIEHSPYPVILCGDFNDTPSSYTYRTVTEGMKDAFRESGSGSGRTYIGIFQSFRIDYILHDASLQSTGYRRVNEKLSDHYPLSCRIVLTDKSTAAPTPPASY